MTSRIGWGRLSRGAKMVSKAAYAPAFDPLRAFNGALNEALNRASLTKATLTTTPTSRVERLTATTVTRVTIRASKFINIEARPYVRFGCSGCLLRQFANQISFNEPVRTSSAWFASMYARAALGGRLVTSPECRGLPPIRCTSDRSVRIVPAALCLSKVSGLACTLMCFASR